MPVRDSYAPPYGDLTELNKNRLILDSVGKKRLIEIVDFFQELLETSTAIYEKNGDYALGLFTSSWCRLMDRASRKLCDTEDDEEALESGKWLCHESCWKDASEQSILQNKVVDIECNGGIHMYAVPILANGEPIGSINLGYGDPPQDKETIMEISEKYNLPYDLLLEEARKYNSKPDYIISAAKKRIQLSAKLIGEIVEHKQDEALLRGANDRLEGFMDSATDGFMIMNNELRVIDANQNWLDRANVTEDVFGTRIDELFPVLRENGRYDAYMRVVETGEPVEFESVRAPSGTGFVYNIKAFKVGEGVGIIVRNISEQVKQEKHIEYLKDVLLAIRNVNQLIVTEKDREILLQKTCDLMIETKGYNHCRIMTVNERGDIDAIYDTNSKLSKIKAQNLYEYPCIEKLDTEEVTIFTDPTTVCKGCPLYSGPDGYAVIGMAISYDEKIFGYFTAAVPSSMTGDEEISLFKEVVGDIAYALKALDYEAIQEKTVNELKESDQRYKLLFNNIIGAYARHKAIYDADEKSIDYIFTEVNDEFEKLTGIPREGLIGEKVTTVLPSIATDPADWIGVYGKLAAEGGSRDFENYSEPLNRWYHVKAYSIEKGHFITIFTDITKRKKAEEILYAESRLFSKLIDPEKNMVEITSQVLEEVKYLTGSEHGYVSMIEQDTGDNIGYTLTNMMDACDVPNFQARFSKNADGTYDGLWGHTLNTKKGYYTNNYQEFTNKVGLPEGHIPIKNFLSVPVLHGEQLVGQICLTNAQTPYDDKDIEALERIANIYALAINRMQYEDSLKKSRERLSGFIESAVDGFSILDQDMKYLMINDTELKYSGLTRDEYIGKHILDVIPDLENTDRYEGYLKVLETGEPVEYKRALHIPERNLWFDFQAFKAGDVLGIISKDVSDQVIFERKLESLHQYAVDSLESRSLEILTYITIDALEDILDFEFCEVSLVKEKTVKVLMSSRPGDFDEIPLNGPGIVVRAVNTGETQYVPDIRVDPDYLEGGKIDESGRVFEILSELTVPVKVGGETRLILNIERSKVDAFSKQDQKLVEILAAHTASAYQLIKERELRNAYTDKLESLSRITNSLPKSKSIDEIAEKIESAVRDIIGFDLGSFGIVKGNVLHHEYVWGVELSENIILPLNGTGVTVRAVQTGETQFIRDTSNESEYFTPEKIGITGSEICVPVKISEEVVAVINIESRETDTFTNQDNSLLSILAEHVGSTMHNLRLLENERDFIHHLESLSTAAASLNTTKTIDEVATQTLEIIDDIMEAPYSSFLIIRGNELVALQTRGSPLIDLPLSLEGEGITARAAREIKTILVEDTRLDPSYVKGSTESLSELAVPIIIEGETIGIINMESLRLGYFDTTHQSLTETLAATVASNIQRIHREEATREAERRVIREQERAEQAEKLDEMKTSFIRTATHEIRTPLTSIKGYTELAQKKIEDNMPELVRYFEVILRNTERLEALTADLLDIQRIESGKIKLNIESVYIHEIIENVILELKPILDSHNQNLIVEGEDALIKADKIRMMQVIVNLAMNASKFSPEGTDIKIIIEKDDSNLQVSVIDEGAGIKEEDIPKLFKPFPGIRVQGVKDSTGLGLSICKGLVELHGGKIWVESDGSGKGSKFTFSCPCKVDE